MPSPQRAQPLWTLSALTIPEREPFLEKLLASLDSTVMPANLQVDIVYNSDVREGRFEIEKRIQAMAKKLPVTVHFTGGEVSIASGRALQLNSCKTPLIAFVDDDVTLHDDVLPAIERTMRDVPLGLVGVPSHVEDSGKRFKPRDDSPSVTLDGVRYAQVQGMLVAGYTNLLREIGGFNPRRRFWGEWTELNLRMWRNGFPTGYRMNAGFLRHWEKAPVSPTRNMNGRERHVLWGLMCTALEYDAVDINAATETFWRLVEDRYLAYSFGDDLSFKKLLKTTLELMPQLQSEWAHIQSFREQTVKHPFNFAPFHPLTEGNVQQVLAHARLAIDAYRSAAFDGQPAPPFIVAEGMRFARKAVRKVTSAMRGWAAS